jgi:hypothetical protein
MSLLTKLEDWFHKDAVAPLIAFEEEIRARLDAIEEKVGLKAPAAPAANPTDGKTA